MKKNEFVDCLYRLFPILIVLVASACGPSTSAGPGNSAPNFTLQAIRGGEYRFQTLLEQPVLLSFIDTQANGGSATSDPSRAQIVFLKSMQGQYGSKGLTVLIVDAASIANGKHPSHDELINFSYDWQLDNIPVMDDPDSSVAKAYGVKSTPVTFLISADGIIQQRWDGFASASQLALSIDALLGASAHPQADTVESPSTPAAAICPNEAQPQAKFSGVGLARPLSEELWVVDGGGPWGTGAGFPVQWILLDVQNLTQRVPIHIEVIGQYADTQDIVPLSDQSMELLPSDVASGLLSGDTPPPTMYSLVTTVFLDRPGCLEIRAVVTRDENTVPLYQGILAISAR